MNQTQSLSKEKHVYLTNVSGWLGSVLVHVFIVAVVLKAGYLPVKKAEIVWVSLSNIVLPLPKSADLSQQKEIEPEYSSIPTEDPVVSAPPVVKTDVPAMPITPDNEAVSKNITIEPKVTQPKPQTPFTIKKAGKKKQKILKPAVDTKETFPEKQITKPLLSPEAGTILKKDLLLTEAKEISVAAQSRYLQTNFDGIRNKVSDNLRYPTMARRQGWQGQVQVKFVILLSGEIDDLQILSSSGYSILDRQALQAIKIAAPFPVPPVVASITIPVTFELN